MADFPSLHSFADDEQKEDFNVGVLLEGEDTVDGALGIPNEAALHRINFCDSFPAHILTRFSTGGDVLKCDIPSPLLSSKTGADVINHYNPKILASGDVEEVFCDKISFKEEKEKASEFLERFMFGTNACACGDFVDAANCLENVADSSAAMTAQPSHFPLQVRNSFLTEDELRYNMQHKERGCFVIFNLKIFDIYNKQNPDEKPLDDRVGSDKDAFNLKNAAKNLGFEHVRILHNCTRIEILQWIYALSKTDHSQYDCFACAILTHGGNGDILYARDAKMKLTEFTHPFCADSCPTLAGKPKLFFIQACRGVKLDHGARITPCLGPTDAVDGPTPIADSGTDQNFSGLVTIPAEADFLIANATEADYYAWRNESSGSWFIQSLCAVFINYGKKLELLQLMTRVNQTVAYEFSSSSNYKDYDQKKQIPSIVTRLTAGVYFTPKVAQKPPTPVDRATCSPSISFAAQAYQSSSEAHHDNVDVVKKEMLRATTTSSPKFVYASGDSNISPGLTRSEATFFPSPKNISKPVNITRAPQVSPHTICPRSQFPSSLESNAIMPGNVPARNVAGRNLSDNESYSQSWNTPGTHPRATVPAGMDIQSSSNPTTFRLSRDRCSVPINRRQEPVAGKEIVRKTFRQTNV